MTVYDYRKMTPQEQAALLALRRANGHPWHAPPHFAEGRHMYLVSAACYEHRALIGSAERRSELEAALIHAAAALEGVQVDAWVVLPNHYHVLVECDFNMFRGWIGRLHNRKATQWNREDGTPGRKVWYRFLDRAIRSERHYYASLNYVHANPVKHGWVSRMPRSGGGAV
jgi:putative transposase